jgi:hypothetical protein
MVLSGGDWPGDSRYWTTEEKANAHAFTRIRDAWPNVTVVEVDPPRISNTNDQATKTEEEGLFADWVSQTISKNYPDKSKWPEFVSRLDCNKLIANLPKFGCLSELEWLRYQEKGDSTEGQSGSWLDRYESDSDVWAELVDLSNRLTHYYVHIDEDKMRLAKAEKLRITIQTRDSLLEYNTKTKKAGLEKIAALMAKHPVEVVFVGGLEDRDELKQENLETLDFPDWLERRWKETDLYDSCPEYLKVAETTGNPKDLPLTVWPEWLEYCRKNNAEERNIRRKNPDLNAEVWEDHWHRMLKYNRSRWKGEMYYFGERGGVYRVNSAGRREYL